MQIYIVEQSEGQYEDHHSWPIKAFCSKEAAEKFANDKQKVYEKLEIEFQSINIDIQELKDKVFAEYLKEVNFTLLTEYETTLKILDELHAKDDYSTQPDFDWDKYYSMQSDFEENKKLFNKYANKCGLSKKELHWLKVDKKYRALWDGIPFFHVSHNPIELVE